MGFIPFIFYNKIVLVLFTLDITVLMVSFWITEQKIAHKYFEYITYVA